MVQADRKQNTENVISRKSIIDWKKIHFEYQSLYNSINQV